MNQDRARALVQEAARRVVPGADFAGLAPDANLRDELEMDSLDFLEFVETLGELSGRDLTEDDYPALVTWDGCAGLLVSRESLTHETRSQ
ncbi:phosphopantetheine-binding protein [Streptomyces sp. NPDC057418]|uniref:phosphopantetheine-binding protein n=1 Tax=unclassified Streptomyces TaxID=2593676 RepID=UPI0036849EA8